METMMAHLSQQIWGCGFEFCIDQTPAMGAGASNVLKLSYFSTHVHSEDHSEHSSRVQWGPNRETLYGAVSQQLCTHGSRIS